MACGPNLVRSICLRLVSGYFYATPVGLSVCDRDHLALYRKCLPPPGVCTTVSFAFLVPAGLHPREQGRRPKGRRTGEGKGLRSFSHLLRCLCFGAESLRSSQGPSLISRPCLWVLVVTPSYTFRTQDDTPPAVTSPGALPCPSWFPDPCPIFMSIALY